MAIECECSVNSECLRKIVVVGNYIAGAMLLILGVLRFIFHSQTVSIRDYIFSTYYM